MSYSALTWGLLNLATIIVLSFYSMMEMAAVSFNKVRLQYYVSKGIKQAIWLTYLLDNPARLFGTTLILVNITTVSGSEFAREFYESIGLNPDLSPITQVILVVIFGELAPMFAARRYPEHVVMLGTPLIYLTAKLMTPFLWILGIISKSCNFLIGGKESETKIFLTQEELLKILEGEDDDKTFSHEREEYDTVTAHILNLHKKQAKDIMNPFESNTMIPSNATVLDAKRQFNQTDAVYLLMHHQNNKNIIGIVFPRDLIRISNSKNIREHTQEPWFVTESTKVLDLLNQFRVNNKNVAIVLDSKGSNIGLINLDDMMEEIFGKTRHPSKDHPHDRLENQLIVERSFPATLTLHEFKELYDVALDERLELTLGELIKEHLGSHPETYESIYIEPFEIMVKETSLTGIRTVSIHTRIK